MESVTMGDHSEARDLEIKALIEQIDVPSPEFPEQALRQLQQLREQAVPALIETIHRASQSAREGNDRFQNACFFAFFLLAEFRAQEALPAILESVTLPGELPLELYDDAIHEVLPRVLATLSPAELEIVDGLILNRAANFYVRWASCTTYQHLVRDGVLSLEEGLQRLRKLLAEALESGDDEIAAPIIGALEALFPLGPQHQAILDEIERAYRLGKVDDSIIDWEWVRKAATRPESERFAHLDPTQIENSVEELRGWAAFTQQPVRTRLPAEPRRPGPAFDGMDRAGADDDDYEPPIGTIVSTHPHVGRNAPCPCGSGKKFKKCCGGRHGSRDAAATDQKSLR